MAQTFLLDFTVDADRCKDTESTAELSRKVRDAIDQLFPTINKISECWPVNGYYVVFSDKTAVIITLRIHNNGLITMAIEMPKDYSGITEVSFDVSIVQYGPL